MNERGEPGRFEARPVVGGHCDRSDLAGQLVDEPVGGRLAEQPPGLANRLLDGLDHVTVIRGGRDGVAELQLRPVVGDRADPPGAAVAGRELREVELPHLVRAGRRHHECRPPHLRVLAAFGLVVDLKQPSHALQSPVHRRVGGVMTVAIRISVAIVRLPHCRYLSAYEVATGFTRSCAGAGHGPFGGCPFRWRCCPNS